MNQDKTIRIIIFLLFLLLLALIMKSPTKYESYNEAIRQCNQIKMEVERNACRLHITNFYEEK